MENLLSIGQLGAELSSNDHFPVHPPLMPAVNVRHGWFWVAILLTVVKLWLTGGQTLFAIGQAIHDDRLFAVLAGHIVKGDWLGPYTQYTLAKGPLFPLFVAVNFWIGLPLIFSQQLLYAAACATMTRALTPWLRHAALQCGFYLILLWNPISFDAGNLTRLMRQNIYTPLALFTIAGLVLLFRRRREILRRLLGPSMLAGLSLGGFWITREESVWLLPAVALLWLGLFASLRRELLQRWRPITFSGGIFLTTALLPTLIISTLNWQHYGWFGTVEFKASEFKAAYGALTRPLVGPELDQVPVTRQMREALYEVSPSFAKLRPYLEGPVGDHWAEQNAFPAAERQMRGGWFVWALRDAVAEAGLAPDAGAALRYYQVVADEVNAACDKGQLPARNSRSGFLPPLSPRLIVPVFETATIYTRYFISFSGFTAYSPDSSGDYADLKPFRDLVGTRLSHAPRSPDTASPEQEKWQHRKVDTLETVGLLTGRVLFWIGPLILLIGLVRGLESAIDHRMSFPLGLAAALLSVCAAYLAINILIQVTSFYNQSPAAMAAAYPLYLTALGAILMDAWQAWRQPQKVTIRPLPAKHSSTQFYWLLSWGTALIAFAAHLGEIYLFAGDVPKNDQWLVEAQQILQPWLNGTLAPGDFFLPYYEHVPMWTRLLTWLQVSLTGRWDPLLQMTINAVLYAGFVGLITHWMAKHLRPVATLLIVGLMVVGGSLPYAWENITGGFQSQYPLALLFMFIHVHGTCTNRPWTTAWWLAQIAALAGLFTLGSMWITPLVVVASSLWMGPRKLRDHAVPIGIAVFGAALFFHQRSLFPDGDTFGRMLGSPLAYLNSCLHLLAWPCALPGAVAILQLPWLIHALRLRAQKDAAPFDRIIFCLGLWNCVMTMIIAADLSGNTNEFISRYGDLHFVGVLSGALALLRLIPVGGRMRSLFLTLAVLWSGLVTSGLIINSTAGHAHSFQLYAVQDNATRLAALRSYLERGDRTLLDEANSRWLLYYQEPNLISNLLDQPRFRTLLPASVYPQNPPNSTGAIIRILQSNWLWFMGGGLVILLIGLIVNFRCKIGLETLQPLSTPVDPWRWRIPAAIAILFMMPMLAWTNPLAFDQESRWQQTLGGDQALKNMTFEFTTPSSFGSERLQGAAPILPEVLRNKFFGTAPDGAALTCTAVSSVFELTQPWLIVPFAGYPVGNGNGLRLRILDQTGHKQTDEIGYKGPNLEGIAFWTIDTRPYQGRQGQLVLYDGRTETEAWVAAASPVPTEDPNLAEKLALRLQSEEHDGSHATLAIIALISALCATISWFGHRRQSTSLD